MDAPQGGLDLTGIAALVTAFSGLVATIGAIFLGLRQRSSDSADRALAMLLELQRSRLDPPAPPKPPPPEPEPPQ